MREALVESAVVATFKKLCRKYQVEDSGIVQQRLAPTTHGPMLDLIEYLRPTCKHGTLNRLRRQVC